MFLSCNIKPALKCHILPLYVSRRIHRLFSLDFRLGRSFTTVPPQYIYFGFPPRVSECLAAPPPGRCPYRPSVSYPSDPPCPIHRTLRVLSIGPSVSYPSDPPCPIHRTLRVLSIGPYD